MKQRSLIYLLAVLMVAISAGCKGKETPKEPQNHDVTLPDKYDMWLAIGDGTSSTIKQDPHVVKKIPTLLEGEYDVRQTGAETLESGITPFVIYHKGYYYSISRKVLNFGKYKITDKGVETIKLFPLPELCDRRFAHAWLDDKTLILIGAPESKEMMNWVKVDVEKMEVIQKGSLKLPALSEKEQFSSCGLLAHRKADNRLLFNFRYEDKEEAKKNSMAPDSHKYFFTATIDPTTMDVMHLEKEDRVDRPGSVSFGSLRHQTAFFDANGDLYMLCNTVIEGAPSSTQQSGYILRIKAGEYRPDPNYKVDLMENSKIITIHHMKGSKAIVYLQNPMYATGKNDWKEPMVFFWAVVDLATKEQHRIEGIPFSQGGTYTELIVVERDYAILGISDKEQTKFYMYDFDSEKVTPVAKLKPGYFADRIIVLDEK